MMLELKQKNGVDKSVDIDKVEQSVFFGLV